MNDSATGSEADLFKGMPLPLVSVVIRTCNRPCAVVQAVQSVLDQTWPHLEIIVVNDGTCQLPLPASSRIPVTVLSPEKKFNRSRAGNTGIHSANGTLVAFLDDDDLWMPAHIATLVSALLHAPWSSIVYSGVAEIDETGHRVKPPIKDFSLRSLFRENLFPIHSALVCKTALEAVGGFDESLDVFEDWDLWLRLARQKFAFLPVSTWTAIYRRHSRGTMTRMPFGSHDDLAARWKIIHKHEPALRNHLARQGPSGRIRLSLRKLVFKIAKDWLT